MHARPRIGLTMRLELETRRFYLGRDYSEAVLGSGGTPVHLALVPDREYIRAALADLDGVLLPGSDTDVDPHRYGEEPHPALKKVIPEKDETDQLVLEEAELLGFPILAICFGMQALNVSRGGSLIQDIYSQVQGAHKHDQGVPLARNSHRIEISDSSILKEISRSTEGKVNSHHHQAISRLGNHLRVTAKALDGIIECVEDGRENRFIVGVQWHPELSWSTDPLSAGLFDRFVEECGRFRVNASESRSFATT